jgi:HlyD family secretion protein
MQQTQIYRKVSLDRLSSPEDLDQALRLAGTKSWAALGAICIILLAALAWGIAGAIVTSAIGQGVLIRQGGVLNVVSRGEGIVTSLHVSPGDRISANDVIGTVAQPILEEKIHSIQEEIDHVSSERQQTFQVHTSSARLQLDAMERQRQNLSLLITEAETQKEIAEEQAKSANQLLQKGLITKEQELIARQKVTALIDQIASLKLQVKQLDPQQYTIQNEPEQNDTVARDRLEVLKSELAEARKEASLAEQVVSPYGGEVLEVKVSPGGSIGAGEPVLSIQPPDSELEMVAYVPTANAKETKIGMPVQISPSTVKAEEFGFLRGKVVYVADYPATQAALMRVTENDALAKVFSGSGPVTEIHVSLERKPNSPSGFAWSSAVGPHITLTSGTLCTVRIVTKQQRPISLLLPYTKQRLGLE